MIKKTTAIFTLAAMPFLLSACNGVGSKSSGAWIVYAVAVFLSLALLIGYCCLLKEKNIWFYLLFTSVLVVNTGYLLLSVSKTLEFTLHANRLAYLGSVFLPFAMLMIIKGACGIKKSPVSVGLLLALSVSVFLVAASPGYLDIYYKSVTLETVNGMSVLNKEYGSWHGIYLIYLLGYFATMFSVIIYASVKKMLKRPSHALILLFSVGINIGVWFLEQLVRIDFELLSVSYIVTELFLIGLYRIIQDYSFCEETAKTEADKGGESDNSLAEKIA